MSNIIQFEDWEDLTENNKPTLRAKELLNEVVRQTNQNTVLSGTGSPEGVVTAIPTTLYMNDAGTAGSILYVKKTGTGNTGWILV